MWEGFLLSTAKRGRRVTQRHHSARAARRKNNGRITALFGLAGLSTTAVTAGSTIAKPHDTVAVNLAQATANETVLSRAAKIPVRISVLSRVRAASRSETRVSADANALNAAANEPDLTASSSGELTTLDRQTLKAFAADSDQLTTIVDDTQQELDNQIAAAQAARKAAALVAAKKAKQKLESQYSTSGNLTYPQEVGQPTRSYNAPIPTSGQIADRISPVKGGYELSARFGQRGGIWSTGWHTGLDFVVPSGTPVRAAAGGTIINAGWAGAYGNRIEVDCGNGYIVTYNHLSRIQRSSGVVSAGDVIGLSGATGNITGPHLHFEVLFNGRFVNPAVWLWGASR
ncbi:MAG: M23 family metallopeptidase [Actinobacteria bacterium]|nr:M23 family metallopeptidase [Actinomycetota bacterium]NBY15331.1 M23 family metallopeptidase [Actinomycetota bacterium]